MWEHPDHAVEVNGSTQLDETSEIVDLGLFGSIDLRQRIIAARPTGLCDEDRRIGLGGDG